MSREIIFHRCLFFLGFFLFGKKILCVSPLIQVVMSLNCLFLLCLLPVKLSVSVDCLWLLKPQRQERSRGGKRCGEQDMVRGFMSTWVHTKKAETNSYTPTQTQRNRLFSFARTHAHPPNRMCCAKWKAQMWIWMEWWSVFIMDPPLGGDVEEEEVLNLHNPFPLPAFKSPLFFSLLVSLPICSCQSTHGRKIRAFHSGITPDSSLQIKQGWIEKKEKKLCKFFRALNHNIPQCHAII